MKQSDYEIKNNIVRLRVYVKPETFAALAKEDEGNPNGAKPNFVGRLVLDEIVRQGLTPALAASGRNQKYGRKE